VTTIFDAAVPIGITERHSWAGRIAHGRNPQSGSPSKIAASKAVRFHPGKAVKDALIRGMPLFVF